MFKELLNSKCLNSLIKSVDLSKVNEIRLRRDKVIKYAVGGVFFTVVDNETVNEKDIDYPLEVASGNALYALNDTLIRGYVQYKYGIRIGVAGECVCEGDAVIGIKNISGLVIRMPSEVLGASFSIPVNGEEIKNTLIISLPFGGKTTFVRDLARRISDSGFNTVFIDERNELTGTLNGVSYFDIGKNSDVITGMKKQVAYELAVRSLNPDVIVTDEVFRLEEQRAIWDVMRSGVRVLATIHGESYAQLNKSESKDFLRSFQRIITLDKTSHKITEMIEND